MLTAYLDESYTDQRYYVAAFIIEDGDLSELDSARSRMDAFMEGFGVRPGTELHAHSLMTGRDGFEPVAGRIRARLRIYQQWMTELAALPAHLVVRGVEVTRLHARYRYPRPPHQIALQHALESVDRFARLNDSMSRIVADIVPGQVAHADAVLRYQRTGTPGERSSTLNNIVPPLVFEDSARLPGLQAADAIAYLHRRRDAHIETDARVAAAVDRLWATVADLVHEVRRWDP